MVDYVKSGKIFKGLLIVLAGMFSVIIINAYVLTLFNAGTYIGTALRYLFGNLIC